MRTILLFLFLVVSFGQAYAQRKSLVFSEKIDFEKQPKQIVEKENAEITDEMDRFLGFGFHFSVKKSPLDAKNVSRKNIFKEGVSVQFGIQLPKYLKTKPPEKLIKTGWNLGLNL
jgi:hypothetical protein